MPAVLPDGQPVWSVYLPLVPIPQGNVGDLLKVAGQYSASADVASTSSSAAANALPGLSWTGSGSDEYLAKHGQLTASVANAVSLLSAASSAVKTYANDLQEAQSAAKHANTLVKQSNNDYDQWQFDVQTLNNWQQTLDKDTSALNGYWAEIKGWVSTPYGKPAVLMSNVPPIVQPPTAQIAAYNGQLSTVANDQYEVGYATQTAHTAEQTYDSAHQAAMSASSTAKGLAIAAHNQAAAAFSAVQGHAKTTGSTVPATGTPAPGSGSGTTTIGGNGGGNNGKGSGTTTIGGNGGGHHGGTSKESIVKQLLALTTLSALRKAVEQDLASHKLTGTDLFALLMALPVGKATQLLTGLPASSPAWTDVSNFTPAQLSQLTTRFAAQGQGKTNDLAEVLAKVPPKDLTKVLGSLSTLPPGQVAKVFTPQVLSGLSQDHVSAVLTSLPAKDLTPVLTALPASELAKVVSPTLLKALPTTGLSHLLSALPDKDVTSVFSAVPTAGLTAKSPFIENTAHALQQLTVSKASHILTELPPSLRKLVEADMPNFGTGSGTTVIGGSSHPASGTGSGTQTIGG